MCYYALKGIKSYDSVYLQYHIMFPVRMEFDFFFFNFSDLNHYNFSFLTSQGDRKQKIKKSPKPLNLLAFVHNVKCLNINLIKFLIQCDKFPKSALVRRYIMVTLKHKCLCVACSLQLPEMLQTIYFRISS